MVDNGDTLQCTSTCTKVLVTLAKTLYYIDFFILHISGANIVLGTQRLQTLGPILTNYASLTTHFQWNGMAFHLQGIHDLPISQIFLKQMKGMQDTKSIFEYYHLEMVAKQSEKLDNLSSAPLIIQSPLQ